MLKRVICIELALFLLTLAVVLNAQELPDVPPSHWAYQHVRQLAGKGLVLGYPDGNFLGDRTLTRYEMAAIVHRVLRQMDQSDSAPVTTNSNAAAAAPAVSDADLESIRKLTEEFKVELTVMGADLKQVQEQVASLRADVDTIKEDLEPIKAQVVDPEGALATLSSDVSKMGKVKISGYAQARFQDSSEAGKGSQFDIRRARLKAQGNVGKKTSVVVQMDLAGTDKNGSVTLKDAYLEYFFKGIQETEPKVTLGQFKWPFGYEVVQSSSDRETPERSDVIRALFPGERDRGFMLSSPATTNLTWNIGLFSGVGIDQKKTPWYSDNFADNNSHKDVVGNLRYRLSDNLQVNASGYWGKAGPAGMLQDRTRWGVDFQWYGVSIPLSIKAEYVSGEEPSGAADAPVMRDPWGYYAQAAWSFSPLWTGVYKYDVYDDDGLSSYGRRDNHQVGVIRWLDDQSRLKFFYEWKNEESSDFKNNLATVEWITKF